MSYMKQKDAQERMQRSIVQANKIDGDRVYEEQMKAVIGKLEHKQKHSMQAYQKNLDQKRKVAKDTNSKMDSVARRAKQVQDTKLVQKQLQFSEQVKKFHEKLVIRKENLDWQQQQTKLANEKRF